jgi:Fe-S-cluster-containing hydrogenase component 2
VIKCDLCGGDPWCAKACPTGAITYVDAGTTGLERMRAWAHRGTPAPGADVKAPAEYDGQSGPSV